MSFKGLVSKLQKGGKSAGAAKKIAGAVAARKKAGYGAGPTTKQKARMSKSEIASANKVQARVKKGGSTTKMGKAHRGKLA